jgi:hypothetical protein
MKTKNWYFIFVLTLAFIWVGCEKEPEPLLIPDEYVSPAFESNVTVENTVIEELSAVTTLANAAESNAQSSLVTAIPYPANLSQVTLTSYQTLTRDWLIELVNAANSPTGFQNPGSGSPSVDEEGGLLGTRLLDENGLELEQMIEKGAFGAALYNHALDVIYGGPVSSADIDKLVEIHGADISFDPAQTTAAATYSRRRSDLQNETGFFYDIRTHLITAKAAVEAGDDYNVELNEALGKYLLAWEQSNFATVIFYCNATKTLLQDAASLSGTAQEEALGNAMHAYAEGVAFAHGFKGLSRKQITDDQIDSILELLLAPEGQTPASYRFLNEASLLANLDQIIDQIQAVYGFSDAEVTSFFVNNNP